MMVLRSLQAANRQATRPAQHSLRAFVGDDSGEGTNSKRIQVYQLSNSRNSESLKSKNGIAQTCHGCQESRIGFLAVLSGEIFFQIQGQSQFFAACGRGWPRNWLCSAFFRDMRSLSLSD